LVRAIISSIEINLFLGGYMDNLYIPKRLEA